jgi:small ligand-binding sensory domain FIST
MKWASAIAQPSKAISTEDMLEQAAAKIKDELSGQAPDLVVVFVSPAFKAEFEVVPKTLKKSLGAKHLIGCSAGGLIGGGVEVEGEAAISVVAAVLPGVKISSFHITDADLPDLDAGPHCWEELAKTKNEDLAGFILLPDPFSFRIDSLVQGLDFAFPKTAKIGGLASGAHSPGGNALFLNSKTYHDGLVGLSLSGNLVVDTIVAQGCRPIGWPMRVTKCHRNFLFDLDGQPALWALHEVLESLDPKEKELAGNSLFLGVVMDEFKEQVKPGDFLIRNIIGLEPTSQALIVGELLRAERTVQFHLRDAATSADDLRLLLKQYRDRKQESASGALLFSCLGRGEHLYGIANHDSDCFKEYMGQVPLGGFFCNGEIGPVGGTTFLHGYTSSFGIFHSKPSKGDKKHTKSD